ncbi:MAG: PH domain-containing protein [Candidatus Methanomethylicia archaeon]
MKIKPHSIAFIELYLIPIYVIAFSIILRFYVNEIVEKIIENMGILLFPIEYMPIIVWAIIMILPFIIMFITKSSIKWLLIGILTITLPVIVKLKFGIEESTLTLIMGIIYLAISNAYRNAHTYYITSERIISEYKFIREKSREISYQYITDIVVEKGIIGRILNVGTIIPISTAGLGLGGDIAAISGRINLKQLSLGVIAGKSVNIPRGRSPNVLFGVKDPIKVKEMISKEISKHSESGLLSKISENLEKILEKVKSGESESNSGTIGDKT